MTTSHARMTRRRSGLCGTTGSCPWASVVEIDTIYEYSPLTTFLWYHHHIGKPFRVIDFPDEPYVQKVIYLSLNNLMAIRVEKPYSLSDWPGRRDDIHLMRSMRGANVGHVQVGPGEYVNVTKQNLPQFFFFLFRHEGADIRVFIWPA